MVIDDGKILESGDHKTLMENKGNYFQMIISHIGELNIGNE